MEEQKTDKTTQDYVAILLEDLKSDFKIFGESLTAVREKGDATFEAVGRLQEDVDILKTDVAVLKTDVAELKTDVSILKTDVGVLKSDMQNVKEELHLIRNELKEKVGREEFVFLETRVTQLERLARH
ncbi:MAG: hypothetical protein AAB949_01260 [Patescibacteria group bacterium]